MASRLRAAISSKNPEALLSVLKEPGTGLDLNVVINGCTPLGLATYIDFPAGVEILLRGGADANAQSYVADLYHWKGTEAPLHAVCRRRNGISGTNNLQIAKILLSHGALTSATDSCNATPLLYAVNHHNHEMAALLIEGGADPRQRIRLSDGRRTSAVHEAIEEVTQDKRVFEILWTRLLRDKSAWAPIDEDGNTPLHIAAKMGAKDLIEKMLSSCSCSCSLSNEHALNKNLEAPLTIAVSFRRPSVVGALVALGRPFSHRLPTFHSPLFRAFRMTLDDGRYDPARDAGFPAVPIVQRLFRQSLFLRICDLIVDAGFSLDSEFWLEHNFDQLRGDNAPVAFRDVSWENVHPDLLSECRTVFDSLKTRRRTPLSLKNLSRLAIRERLLSKCPSCWGVKHRISDGIILKQMIETLELPAILRRFLMFRDE